MHNITFELTNDMPYYIQIYKEIIHKIDSGEIKPFEKLPSKRSLAINLGVSVNTILNAYVLLQEEGYIFSKEKKGYFVTDQPKVHMVPSQMVQMNTTSPIVKYDLTTQNIKDIDFSYKKFQACVKEALIDKKFINRSPLEGIQELRDTIAQHLLQNRGMIVHPNQIIIGTGLELLETIFPLLTFSSCAIENPGYHKLVKLLNKNHYEVEFVSIDSEGVNIPQTSTLLYTTPFNQFPTGIKMSISRKKELINWAKEKQGFIIEDDFDAEFRLSGAPASSLYSLDPEHVIFFSTFSTTIFAGFRAAYMILPPRMMEKYKAFYTGYSNPVSTLDQRILYYYIKNGDYARQINHLKKQYLKKRNLIEEFFKTSPKIKVDSKKNYISMILNIDTSIPIKTLLEILKKEKVYIHDLSYYDHNKKSKNQLILGYTNIDEVDLLQALEIINNTINKML